MNTATHSISEWQLVRVRLTRRFFVAAIVQLLAATAIGLGLSSLIGRSPPADRLTLPAAFQFATFFLALGSWFMHRAIGLVKLERQVDLRQMLLMALSTAVLFVGVQSFGLWQFVHSVKDYQQTQLNVHGFVFMFTALHALHFLVAQSVLLWVTLSAFMDRYDHEYYWGITFAAWCWHVLGIAWLAILCVFAIAS